MVIQQESLILQVLQFCTCFFQKKIGWLEDIYVHTFSHYLKMNNEKSSARDSNFHIEKDWIVVIDDLTFNRKLI